MRIGSDREPRLRPAHARVERLALAAHDEHVPAERAKRNELRPLRRRRVHRPGAGGEDAEHERRGDRGPHAGNARDAAQTPPPGAHLRQRGRDGRLRRPQRLGQPPGTALEVGAIRAPA